MNRESPDITVYGADWCPDCRRAKKFLGEQLVAYRWVDIEQDEAGRAFVEEKNNGKRIIPTIVFDDGSFLVEPSNAELAGQLGLKTEAKQEYYDIIIVGGGPAGLTAGIYAAREGMETLVIERSGLGGQAGLTQVIDNFPGFPEGLTGQEFADRLVQQARRFEVELLQAQEVSGVEVEGDYRVVRIGDGSSAQGRHYCSKVVLATTGSDYRRLDVPGEEDLIGAGIHFCATCDGPFYKGSKQIVVVGGGNSAAEESLHLERFTDEVLMLVRGQELTASRTLVEKIERHPGIKVRYGVEVQAFEGEKGKLKTVVVKERGNGRTLELHPAAAFIFIGQTPNSQILKDVATLDRYGFVLTGHDLEHLAEAEPAREPSDDGRSPLMFETSLPGVFAAGDVRKGSTKQIASAVGEGAAAVLAIREYLKLAGG